jgi:hypothetical protein
MRAGCPKRGHMAPFFGRNQRPDDGMKEPRMVFNEFQQHL